MIKPRFLPLGETGITVEFGNEISSEINSQVANCHKLLKNSKLDGVLESVPTYRSLSVYYDPIKLSFEELQSHITSLLENKSTMENISPVVYEIPVWYSTESGADLDFVAKHNNKTIDQVIKIHSQPEYLIYMLGFTPGFPYLGGMSKEIATPRLSSPRIKIEAGSVGIAGSQTGIYSLNSPGGWQLIGKTPLKLYNPTSENPILLKSGNYIKFVPIDKETFIEIENQVQSNSFTVKTYPKEVE